MTNLDILKNPLIQGWRGRGCYEVGGDVPLELHSMSSMPPFELLVLCQLCSRYLLKILMFDVTSCATGIFLHFVTCMSLAETINNKITIYNTYFFQRKKSYPLK